MKTTLKTNYSNSPVISISIRYGHMSNQFQLLLALTSDGNIYRTCKQAECVIVDEFEVELSDLTNQLISAEYITSNIGLTELGKKIEIQKWLQKGVAYISYSIAHEPLHSLSTERYYDVMELNNKYDRIRDYQKTIEKLREFGTENEKSIKKIKAEREKIALKSAKFAEKAKQEKIKENSKLIKSELKKGNNYIAVIRVYSNKGRSFHGETIEFRSEKPRTNNYFEITKENISVIAEKIISIK